MNIEQIALEVDNELCVEGIDIEANEFPAEFLRRCLSKLAEQDAEPVGYIYCYQGQDTCFSTEPQDASIPITYYEQKRVFTETQLLAAQQRTAEACAKACEVEANDVHSLPGAIVARRCAEAIRNGEWRKYL